MAELTVTVIAPGGRQLRQVRLPNDAPLREILPVILSRLEIEDNPSNYSLHATVDGQEWKLDPEETLESLGVTAVHTLRLRGVPDLERSLPPALDSVKGTPAKWSPLRPSNQSFEAHQMNFNRLASATLPSLGSDEVEELRKEVTRLYTILGELVESVKTTERSKNRDLESLSREIEGGKLSVGIRFPPSELEDIAMIRIDNVLRIKEQVRQMEEHRADEKQCIGICFGLWGGSLGVIVNWATAGGADFSPLGVVLCILLLGLGGASYKYSRSFHERVERLKDKLSEPIPLLNASGVEPQKASRLSPEEPNPNQPHGQHQDDRSSRREQER